MLKNSQLPASLFTRAMLIIILLVLFAAQLQGSLNNTITFDEPSHLAAGYAFLQQGIQGLWTVSLRGHPVLFNAWEALPIYVAEPNLPVDDMSGWRTDRRTFSSEFIHTVSGLSAVTFASRLPTILCMIVLTAVLWRVATDIWDKSAGFLSVLILCFDPLILSHGRLATNDVAITAFGGLYLYISWRWSRNPTWIKTVILGILLGVTMLIKATGALFGAVGLIWSLWIALRFKTFYSTRRKSLWLHILVLGCLALGVIWISYGFSFGPTSFLPNLPVPAPVHWDGTIFQAENAVKREVYAFGYKKTGRWWWYFPFAFLLKNPLPLLFSLPFSFFVLLKWKKITDTNQTSQSTVIKDLRFAGILLPIFFGLTYMGAALLIGPNIGYRHFLPIQPLLYLTISGACYLTWSHVHKIGRLLLLVLGCWYAIGTARIYPYEISFFNELSGGPDQGWRYLTTSNTDWLQGWKALHTWQQETGIHFSYTGPEGYLGLRDYDIDFTPLPPVKGSDGQRLTPWLFPIPGDYIVGSSILSGMNVFDEDNFSWFRYREPNDVIAHSLYYYKITPEEAPVWVAQCSNPVVPLNEHGIENGYGTLPLRLLSFDCTKSWIYPGGGQSNGHYVLHASQLTPETWRTRLHLSPPIPMDSFTERRLHNTPMAARERRNQEFPALGVYAWHPQDLFIEHQTAISGPVAEIPKDHPESILKPSPQSLNEGLTFLGINLVDNASTLEVETWWRVERGAITRPLSVMAHLLTQEGKTLEVEDGLNTSPLIWQNGDIVVQRHTFSFSCKMRKDLWLRTGIYWLDTLDRWKVGDTGDDAIFLSLCDTP